MANEKRTYNALLCFITGLTTARSFNEAIDINNERLKVVEGFIIDWKQFELLYW